MNFSWSQLDGGWYIAYHKDWVLAVNKNPKTLVHPIPRVFNGTLVEQVEDVLRRKTFLAHRLDYDTSGAIVFWLDVDTIKRLNKSIETREGIVKKYRCVVTGKVPDYEGVITHPIFDPKNWWKCHVSNDGKKAETHYRVLNQKIFIFGKVNFLLSYLEIEIKTGRRHQIRLHCAESGFPIIWDGLYWDFKKNNIVSREFWLDRQALHSHFFRWDDIATWQIHEIRAKIHNDMKGIIHEISTQ
jgi:23S rRNA-/tRNA-specific pseudouridylate synthase